MSYLPTINEPAYLELLDEVLRTGNRTTDRTGVGTLSVFGRQIRYTLGNQIPVFTTKQVHWKSVVHELLWFLSGSTDNKVLQSNGVKIWDAWATEDACAKYGRREGDLGPIYGFQWRHFGEKYTTCDAKYQGFDQISWVIREIIKNPSSRRLIVNGWNPNDAEKVSLPPCHTLFQFHVQGDRLSCHLFQRSADLLLGVPFNVASYSLLTHMIAHLTGLKAHEFVHTMSNAHIYMNHIDAVQTQLKRIPYAAPRLTLSNLVSNIFEFRSDHITLEDYVCHPKIPAPVAI